MPKLVQNNLKFTFNSEFQKDIQEELEGVTTNIEKLFKDKAGAVLSGPVSLSDVIECEETNQTEFVYEFESTKGLIKNIKKVFNEIIEDFNVKILMTWVEEDFCCGFEYVSKGDHIIEEFDRETHLYYEEDEEEEQFDYNLFYETVYDKTGSPCYA